MIALQDRVVESLAYKRCEFDLRQEIFHVKKLSSQLTECRWFYSGARLCPKYYTEGHLIYSYTNIAEKSPYSLGATLDHTKENCIVNIDIVKIVNIDLNFTSFVVLETV